MTRSNIQIQLNGEDYKVPAGVHTIAQLLEHLSVGTRIVIVERNREVVEQELFHEVALEEGDKVEIVHFVGGGEDDVKDWG